MSKSNHTLWLVDRDKILADIRKILCHHFCIFPEPVYHFLIQPAAFSSFIVPSISPCRAACREDRPVLSFTGCFFPLRHRALPRRLPFFAPPVKQGRNARRARRHRHGLCPARGLLPGHPTAFDQQSIVISPAVQYNYPNKEALHHGHRKNGTVYC